MTTSTHAPTELMVKAFEEATESVIQALFDQPNCSTTGEFRLKSRSVIQMAIVTLKLIKSHDVAWHQAMFEETIPYNEADHEGLLDLHRAWYSSAKKLLNQLDEAVLTPSEIRVLRSSLAEVKSALTPDDEFFEGDELDKLVEQAIDEHSRAETDEMKEMGD